MKLKIVAGCSSVRGSEVKVKRGPAPGQLRVKSNPWALFYKTLQVASLDWAEASTRSVGKAAAGAAVGGLLTGGIGLVAGAVLGGRKRNASNAVLQLADGQRLVLRATGRDFAKLQRLVM